MIQQLISLESEIQETRVAVAELKQDYNTAFASGDTTQADFLRTVLIQELNNLCALWSQYDLLLKVLEPTTAEALFLLDIDSSLGPDGRYYIHS